MQKVATLADLSFDRAIRVMIDETPILLIRAGERVHAYSADCPHAGAPLEEGGVCNGRIVCPWHKGTFEISDGSLVEPPALKGLSRYPVEVRGGDVMVSPEAEPEPAAPPRGESSTMLIAGAGAAGAAACAALRETGFAGRIVLAGDDARMPYDRTALSKFVVAGDMPPDDVPPLLDPAFIAQQRIERMETRVVRLDARARRAHLENGETIDYDAALICTGGTPKPLDIPGATLRRVHFLRHLDDARAIVESAAKAKRAVIIGASFIGLEVASCLAKREIDVTVIASDSVPFASQFGATIGAMFKRLHERNGVQFRVKAKATAFEGDGAVAAVVLESGEKIAADFVVIGTGVTPATAFVEGIELADDHSIPVDTHMQAAPGLFAAGDIAQFALRSGNAVRIEHWRVAQQHARVAALNMAGVETAFAGVPYFWTYHVEKRFDYLGHVKDPDDTVIDGDLDAQSFIAYLLKDGMVAAVVACEREAATARLAEAMREPLTLDAARRVANVEPAA